MSSSPGYECNVKDNVNDSSSVTDGNNSEVVGSTPKDSFLHAAYLFPGKRATVVG